MLIFSAREFHVRPGIPAGGACRNTLQGTTLIIMPADSIRKTQLLC